jgi:UDP-glucose 4-epimerase
MRIAVTGGSGFIGSRIVDILSSSGHEVLSLDVNPPERSDSFEFRRVDLTSFESTLEALRGAEIVFHIAGVVLEYVRGNPFKGSELNVDISRNVVESARRSSISKVIFASSFYVYDGIKDDMIVNESTPLNTLDMELFGATKVFGESLLKEYARRYGIKYVILRFGSAYGSGNCSNVIKTFIADALDGKSIDVWGPGKRRNQYTYVEDLARGSVLAMDKENEIYNLISPEETSIKQLTELIAARIPVKVTFNLEKKEGVSMPYMSSRKAMNELGWAPIPVEKGVEILVREMTINRPLIQHTQSAR